MIPAPDPEPLRADLPAASGAFEALFRAHFDFVYANLRRLGVAPAAVDDAAQEVFLVVFRRAGTPVASIRGWLYGIVRRIAWRHRRSATRQRRLTEALVDEPARAHDLPAAIQDREAMVLLDRFLAGLDDAKREVFVLAELEEMTAPEIARALEIKENTVYSRLRAARQEFDRSLARARLRDERERLRRAHDPSPATRSYIWICLSGQVGAGGAGGALTQSPPPIGSEAVFTSGAAAGGQVAWAAVVGALGLAVVVGAPARSPAPAEPVSSIIASATGPTEHVVPDMSRTIVPDAPAPTPASTIPAPPAAASAPSPSRPLRPSAPLAPAGPPPPSHALADMSQAPPPVLTADALAREAALMASARAELRAGAWPAARALLDRHTLEFPAGALVEERRLSLITALCESGELEAGRAEQARIVHEQPDSAFARKALALCDGGGENSPTTPAAAGD